MPGRIVNNYFSIFILGVITVVGDSYFAYVPLNDNSIAKMTKFVLVLFVFLYSYSCFVKDNKNRLSKLVRYVLISIFISMFSSLIVWGQSLLLSYRIGYQILLYIVFFYIVKRNIQIRELEYFLLFFGLLYSVLWFYSISQFPTPVFGLTDEFGMIEEDDSRGMQRLTFIGMTHMIPAYLLCLVKYNVSRKKIYLLGVFYFFLIIVFQLTRQVILWSFVVGAVYFIYYNRKYLALITLLLIGISIGASMFVPKDNVISAMINVTMEQADANKYKNKDIRLQEYEFFFTDYSPNIIAILFGNGIPHTEGPYGEYAVYLSKRYGYYLSDVGYAYIYGVLGICGLIIFIRLIIKALMVRLPPPYMYAKLFVWYAVFTNIASGIFFEPPGIVSLCIMFYILGKKYNDDKRISDLNVINNEKENLLGNA